MRRFKETHYTVGLPLRDYIGVTWRGSRFTIGAGHLEKALIRRHVISSGSVDFLGTLRVHIGYIVGI